MAKCKSMKTSVKESEVIEVKAVTTEEKIPLVRMQALKAGSNNVITRSTLSNKVLTVATFRNKKMAREFQSWLEKKHSDWLDGIDEIESE